MADLIHEGPAHHVAEEGSFAASTAPLPLLHYYPCRGRAEPIRLVLSYMAQPWFEPPPPSVRQIHALMHQEFDGYPFRQLPRFIEEVQGQADLVQSHAILRHLGRKYGLYGKNLVEAGRVDMLLDAVREPRDELRAVWLDQGLAEAARQQYDDTVLATVEQLRNSPKMGPGLGSLEYVLAEQRFSATGWFVGDGPTLADFVAFDLVDLNLVHFEQQVRGRFPALSAHHGRVAGLTGVADYLASASRHPIIWANEWMQQHGLVPGGSGA